MAKNPPKLHELLAVETQSKQQADAILKEADETFTKRSHHFNGSSFNVQVTRDPDSPEGRLIEKKLRADHQDRDKPLVTTVDEKLKYVVDSIRGMWDVCFQIAESNTRAKANVVVDGSVLIANAPATFLLEFEKKLLDLRKTLHRIPTYDPAKDWTVDKDAEKQKTWKTRKPRTSVSTKKEQRAEVVIQPTKEHPGQYREYVEDIPVAELTVQEVTGAYSPGDKSEMLARTDKLIKAVRRAKTRANGTDACRQKISSEVAKYVLDGALPPPPTEEQPQG